MSGQGDGAASVPLDPSEEAVLICMRNEAALIRRSAAVFDIEAACAAARSAGASPLAPAGGIRRFELGSVLFELRSADSDGVEIEFLRR
ncbi:MAG TPA: hypothetical protein VGG37_08500 [Opitutaceae bacterium]|jgi:hypothetical protein